MRRILGLPLERTLLGTPTAFVKVRAHSSDELNVTADRLADMGHAMSIEDGVLPETYRERGLQYASWTKSNGVLNVNCNQ